VYLPKSNIPDPLAEGNTRFLLCAGKTAPNTVQPS
jgi:hypothetical protein